MSTELFESIKTGDAAKVTTLLDGDAELANAVNEQGIAAHTFAIYNRKPEIAELVSEGTSAYNELRFGGRSEAATRMLRVLDRIRQQP